MAGLWQSKQFKANVIVLYVLWIATLVALIVVVAVYEANKESVIRDILPTLPTREKQTNLNAPTDTSGIIGSRGEKGEKGNIGLPGVGIKGEAGRNGIGGPPGERGYEGIPGGNGPQGMPGEKGQKGDDGTIGRPGEDGETAISGLNGTKGEPATAVIDKIELLEQEYAILNTTIQETRAQVELLINHLKSIDATFNPELDEQGILGNPPCPADYVCNLYSETCFIKNSTNMNWDEAKQFCEGHDEHTAILDSEESIHWFENMTINYSGEVTLRGCLTIISGCQTNILQHNKTDDVDVSGGFENITSEIRCANQCDQHEKCFGFIHGNNNRCLSVECTNILKFVNASGSGEGVDFPINETSYNQLARDKPASMSSIYHQVAGRTFFARYGNDGVYIPRGSDFLASLAHTNGEDYPWWRVDLQEMHCVWAVNILNRVELGQDFWRRTKNVAVTVAVDEEVIAYTGDNNEVLCYYHEGEINQYYTLMTCKQPIGGRYVQIQLLEKNGMLNFYEIEVHGM